jgi:hypothetical protein
MTQATHDYSIANDTGSAVRTDLNTLFTEIEAANAGTSAPSNLATGKLWYDTANNLLKQYNGSSWVTIMDSTGGTFTGAVTLPSPVITGTPTGITAAHLEAGVLPSDVTGGSGLTALGTVTSGNLANTAIVYPAGMPESIAIICDEKAYNVSGGSFSSGAWRTRDLNTEISDANSIVSISSNQFTLQAGKYIIEWVAPAYNVAYHLSKLYGVTSLGNSGYGTSNRTGTAGGDTEQKSNGMAHVTLSGAEVFEIQHKCNTTRTHGFGAGQSSLDSATVSIFTIVKITKTA